LKSIFNDLPLFNNKTIFKAKPKPVAKKKKKPKTNTNRSAVRAVLRKLWMWSPERRLALKRAGNACECCGIKESKKEGAEVKIEVHHIKGIKFWVHILDLIMEQLFCDPKDLIVLCKGCHDAEHIAEAGE
jgi:hypothetical protein